MDFLSSAGRAFKKAIKSTASKLTGVGYVVAVKMPSDVINVITNRVQSEETSDAEELNFTLERLGVLSGGNQRNAADFDEFQAPGLLGPVTSKDYVDGCILADDGKVIGRQSQYTPNLWAPDYQPQETSPQMPRTSSVPKFQTQSPSSYRLETRSVGSRMETQSVHRKLNLLGQNQDTSLLALIEDHSTQRPESSSRSLSEYRPKKPAASSAHVSSGYTPNVFYAPAGSIIEPRTSKLVKAMTEIDDGEGHTTSIHRRFHQNQKKKRKQLKKFKRREMEEGLLMLSVLFRRHKRKVLRAILNYSRSMKLRSKQVDLRVKLAINGIKSVFHRKIQKINFELLHKLRKMAEMAENIKRETSVAVIREASSGEEEEDLKGKVRVPQLKLSSLIRPITCVRPHDKSQRSSGYEPSPYMTPTLRSDRQSTRRINIDESSQSSVPTASENAAVFRPNMDQLNACSKLRDTVSKRFTKWALHFWLRLRDRQLRSVHSQSRGMWKSSSFKQRGLTSYHLQPLRMGEYPERGPQSELSPDIMRGHRSKADLARYVEERRRIVFRKQYSQFGFRQPPPDMEFLEVANESTQIYTPMRQSPQRQLNRSKAGGLLPELPFGEEISESENEEEFKRRLSTNRFPRLPRKKFESEVEEDTEQEEFRGPFRRKQKTRIFEMSDEISSIMQRSHSLSRSTNIASLPHLLLPFANNPGEFDQEAYRELFADELESRRITPMTEEVKKQEEEIQEETEEDFREEHEKMEQDIQHFSQILSNGRSIFEEIKDIVQQNQLVANKYKDLMNHTPEPPPASGRSEASSQESLKVPPSCTSPL